MASLKDILSFESFNLKDMWNKIKESPETLLLGAAEPLGAELWGGITGKDYSPLVNAFGGPADDVWGRAKAAGIDTGFSKGSHDAAKVVSGLMAGNYGLDKLGLTGPVNNSGFDWRAILSNIPQPQQQQQSMPMRRQPVVQPTAAPPVDMMGSALLQQRIAEALGKKQRPQGLGLV